ncbi:hypothetical protein ACFSZS_16495 [Seohaeicola zhoushanensis]
MLRRQSPNFDKTSFLGGPSEMAARIRAFDWTDHPLGPPDSWPEALRAALGIALNSAFPTCIYWGSELRLLYNDSWSAIPGPRHPGCLGEPAAEVWSDIWHIIEPQFLQAITTGQGVFLQDQMLPMRRFGVEEETYWTYNFTPILLDDGSIGGIFNSGHETTRQVLQQRSTQLLLELSDVFRTVPRVEEVRAQALDLLGRHLAADRVGLRAWTDKGPTPPSRSSTNGSPRAWRGYPRPTATRAAPRTSGTTSSMAMSSVSTAPTRTAATSRPTSSRRSAARPPGGAMGRGG